MSAAEKSLPSVLFLTIYLCVSLGREVLYQVFVSSHETIVNVRREYFKVLHLLHWAAACQQTVFTSLSAHSCWLKKKLISSVVPCAFLMTEWAIVLPRVPRDGAEGIWCLFSHASAVCEDPAWKLSQGWATSDVIAEAAGGAVLLLLLLRGAAGNAEQDSGTWKDQFSLFNFLDFQFRPNVVYVADLFRGPCDHTKEQCFYHVGEMKPKRSDFCLLWWCRVLLCRLLGSGQNTVFACVFSPTRGNPSGYTKNKKVI